jgi:putative endonuclease
MPRLRSAPKAEARLKAEQAGRRAEIWAALFLQAQFYRILERRYKSPVGEIDLIARRFGTLVFVEVKARASLASQAEALMAVNQARIIRAARSYLARHPQDAHRPMRFDVIFLAPRAWPRHVKNAFSSR